MKKPLILQTMPNEWCCAATAFAMVLGVDVQDVFKMTGHDGTRKLWPEVTDERTNRGGHHIQELIDLSYNLGFMTVPIDAYPMFGHFTPSVLRKPPLWSEEKCLKRLEIYLKNNYGILWGTVGFNMGHAVAWDGDKVYDPRGSIIDMNKFEFNCATFYLMRKIY